MMPRGVGPILRPMHPIAPRGAPGHAIRPHGIGKFHANDIGKFRRTVIPPSAHGYATTTARPFDRLVRRHHVIDQSGWVYPTTIGGDYPYGYIGVPYDPIEAIPVYGPAPAYQESDPPPRGAPAAARVTNPDDEGRDGCRVERVTVPSGSGEREIKVVRC